jgi:hypothetical protein
MRSAWPPRSRRARRRAAADYDMRRRERLVEQLDGTLARAHVITTRIERAAERIAEAVGDG